MTVRVCDQVSRGSRKEGRKAFREHCDTLRSARTALDPACVVRSYGFAMLLDYRRLSWQCSDIPHSGQNNPPPSRSLRRPMKQDTDSSIRRRIACSRWKSTGARKRGPAVRRASCELSRFASSDEAVESAKSRRCAVKSTEAGTLHACSTGSECYYTPGRECMRTRLCSSLFRLARAISFAQNKHIYDVISARLGACTFTLQRSRYRCNFRKPRVRRIKQVARNTKRDRSKSRQVPGPCRPCGRR